MADLTMLDTMLVKDLSIPAMLMGYKSGELGCLHSYYTNIISHLTQQA